uniref:4-hydroxy-3-methylbut-2-en-1-yl diphosphate synthase (ferredoxin), chloroplastic n=1 Tax=Haematococcus lacustris TaxID=44745 RepID=A0A0H3V8D4_HAELA|nr:1-hydroxy-2-methyl-2-(E)-butenyl 4-diphosphate synthase [Haematococcus lacustris]
MSRPTVKAYCESTHQTKRRPTRTVTAGKVLIGGSHRVALQTMTTTDTRDVQGTVDQVKKCADAGADLVRITVQGRKEAEACMRIREQLFKDRYDVPLVADIHFQPAVAMMVAEAFEKVRINPGNFADGRKTFETINYDDPAEFEAERAHIEEVFTPLVLKCKELNRAMRIGTNHGSLSARILSFYGDTPRGMVQSAFEFADICRKHDYHNFVFSMKASNPLVMVQAYRLLAEEMYSKSWDYPLHLGVTEAGEGEDGRMKSAIGIGALLMDGLGDTIRVSLTEDPEYELDPCRRLAGWGRPLPRRAGVCLPLRSWRVTPTPFKRRTGDLPMQKEADTFDFRGVLHRDGSVLSAVDGAAFSRQADVLYKQLGCKLAVGMPFKDIATSDSILVRQLPDLNNATARLAIKRLQDVNVHLLVPLAELAAKPLAGAITLCDLSEAVKAHRQGGLKLPEGSTRFAVSIHGTESDEELAMLQQLQPILALLDIQEGLSTLHASRRVFESLARANVTVPIVHHMRFGPEACRDDIVIRTGSIVGGLLVDGLGEGVLIEAPHEDLEYLRTTSFGLLQGSRMRNIKTEYVSCPSCGRTLFNLQEVTDQIRQKTGHLPGVAIAVMGCIVNGPGEMADADFGYVGGAPGKIDLYVGKEVVKRGLPMESACDELVQLIKDHGRWQDLPVEELVAA